MSDSKTMLSRFLCLLLLVTQALTAQSDDGLSLYREGNYESAIPLLQAAVEKDRNQPLLQAALLSALVYEGKVDSASELSQTAATQFPDSPEVTAARGELAYYMGDMTQAETLFRAALKPKDNNARAIYGLSRLYRAASLFRTARLLCLRAHAVDPDDALIMSTWLNYAGPEKRKELLGPFIAAHPWFYKEAASRENTASEISHELNGRKAYEFDGEKQETTLHLINIVHDARHTQGVGLEFRIPGRPSLRLLLDTGASGILISERAVDKAGLNHLGSMDAFGIGGEGKRTTFGAVAETCQIAELTYKNCVIRAAQGRQNVAGDADGLIGADFFAGYLVQIDFQKRQLHLTPLPAREANPQGYDREIPADEKDFTPVFRAGTHLYVSTKLNDKIWGLFLLDTGASISSVDSTFARLSTKVYSSYNMHVRGVSGEVKDVFEADKAMLQFARFRQANLGLTAFDLNTRSEHQDFRMSGILGVPVLSLFRMTIDYRNGLVKLDYVLDKKPKS